MKVLLTGAGGFAGAHVFEHVLATTDWDLIATDSFRHKGRCDRLARILWDSEFTDDWRRRSTVLMHDLAAPFSDLEVKQFSGVDVVIAMASESHVDRSIADPVPFVRNNVDLMLNTMELCRELKPRVVIVISTDEVYGPVQKPGETYKEWSTILPSNPYSASKAAQEAIAFSYWRTYDVPVVIVNCMNLVGEMQDPEKFIPMVIRKVLQGETVQVHGIAGNVGSRSYIHARNLADALVFLAKRNNGYYAARYLGGSWGGSWGGRLSDRPDRYNIAGLQAIDNLELAQTIARYVDRPLRYELVDFHSARPGHDPHYGLDGRKLAGLGWRPPVEFWESLERCVGWTVKHPEWLGL